MKQYYSPGVALVLMIFWLLLPGQAVADKIAKKMPPKEYILSIDTAKAKQSLNAITKITKNLGNKRFTTLSKYTGRDYYVLKFKEEERSKERQLIKLSQATHGVTFSPVSYRYLNTTPNDPDYSKQWCHSNSTTPGFDMGSEAAWDITTGSKDVVVAVIDTGVDYLHPDLVPNMWTNAGEIPNNGIDDDGNGYVDDVYGIDSGNNDSDPMDYYGHGTHCAGIIGAVGNNETGVAGVNWNVKIMAVKGFDEAVDSMSTTEELEAYNYLLMMKNDTDTNIVAVNASYGFTGEPDENERDGIAALGKAGILFCAAAGNDSANNNSGTSTTHYPSSYPLENIIAVAATDASGGLASFSNFGATTVDLGAPGDSIYSTMLHSITFEVDPETTVYYEDFESGDGGFTLESPWAVTEEHAVSGTHALSDSPNGNYDNSLDLEAVSPAIDLSGQTITLALGFKAMHDTEVLFDNLEVWFLSPEVVGDLLNGAVEPEEWAITQEKAASGNSSWTDSPNGDYSNNTHQWLLSPVVDLSSAAVGTEFSFKLTGDTEAGWDFLTVYFSNDGGKTLSEAIFTIDGDYSEGWQTFSAVIPEEYLTQNFMAVFVLDTDFSITRAGYYLDDIQVASGNTVLFFDDVENGVGQWREPADDAELPSPSKWEEVGDKVGGSSEGQFKSYAYEIPQKYFWDGFKFKLVMHSDISDTDDGVYIDDIGIGIPENVYGYKYMSGTSMATPQVTGAVALVASHFKGISASDIKTRILDGAVPVDVLEGKTLTGAHLNLSGALADPSLDSDNDTIPDHLDNCVLTPNTDQRDTDNDGFGNTCDCDLDNDNVVTSSDFIIFREAWGTTNADADFDGDGSVNMADFNIFRGRWGTQAPFK